MKNKGNFKDLVKIGRPLSNGKSRKIARTLSLDVEVTHWLDSKPNASREANRVLLAEIDKQNYNSEG